MNLGSLQTNVRNEPRRAIMHCRSVLSNVRNEPRRTSPLPWPKAYGKTLFSILRMLLIMGHMGHLGMTPNALVWAT